MANGLRVPVLGPLEVTCNGVAVGPASVGRTPRPMRSCAGRPPCWSSAPIRASTPGCRSVRRSCSASGGNRTGAAAALDTAAPAFHEDELPPERIVWFVETALLHARPDPVTDLARLSHRTGVQVPPWERQWAAIEDGGPPGG